MDSHILPKDFNWKISDLLSDELKTTLSMDVSIYGHCVFVANEIDGNIKIRRVDPLDFYKQVQKVENYLPNRKFYEADDDNFCRHCRRLKDNHVFDSLEMRDWCL